MTPPPNGAANTTLTVTVNSAVAPGNYWIRVVGTSGGVARGAKIDLSVAFSAAGRFVTLGEAESMH